MKAIIYDTETSGLPKNYKASYKDVDNWPRLVMLNWDVWEFEIGELEVVLNKQLLSRSVNIIKPEGFTIPEAASRVHGISQEKAIAEGQPLVDILWKFKLDISDCDYEVGHNVKGYDRNVIAAEFERQKGEFFLLTAKPRTLIDTMLLSTNFCKILGPYGNKWPKLGELYRKLFNKDFDGAHTEGDVPATAECFFELLRLGVIKL